MLRSFVIAVAFVTAACGGTKKSKTVVGTVDPTQKDGSSRGEMRPADVTLHTSTGDDMSWLRPVYFAFDSADLSNDTRETLQKAHEWLAAHPNVTLTIEGHCDEQGTTEYNIGLGQRRAQAMVDFLARLGTDGKRLGAVSFGAERPAVDGHDEIAWSQNRRGEFKVAK